MDVTLSHTYICPNCKTTEHGTLMDLLGNTDKETGRILKETVMSTMNKVMATNIKRKIGEEAIGAIVYYDICLSCGQEYAKQIDEIKTTVQASTQQPKIIVPGYTPPKLN